MAKAQGVSHATVQRVWDAHGLHPHRATTFKLSTDPAFVDKLTDIVGLYMNPPERAVCCASTRRVRFKRWTAPSPGSR